MDLSSRVGRSSFFLIYIYIYIFLISGSKNDPKNTKVLKKIWHFLQKKFWEYILADFTRIWGEKNLPKMESLGWSCLLNFFVVVCFVLFCFLFCFCFCLFVCLFFCGLSIEQTTFGFLYILLVDGIFCVDVLAVQLVLHHLWWPLYMHRDMDQFTLEMNVIM